MKSTFQLLVPMVVVFLISLTGQIFAQKGDAASQQEQLNQMLDMMKQQGMDPKAQKQFENMMGDMAKQGARIQSAKMKKAQQKFEAETAGHGTAEVEVEGKQYQLTMIECKVIDRSVGHFSMRARQAPGMGKGELWLVGGRHHTANRIAFSPGKGNSYEGSNLTFQLLGKTLKWEGQVIKANSKKVSLKIHMICGAEMVDYAKPSKPNPASSVNVLRLETGEEAHTFQAGHCSTAEYRTGNLMVQFEATATGTFRGRPAIVLLSKSHPVGSTQTFQNMDVLLGELTREQRLLSPLKVAEELRDTVNAYTNKEMVPVKKSNKKLMVTFQKKYGKEAPKDPSKMGEWMNAFNKVLDDQSKAVKKVQDQAKAMTYPKARSFGAITVKGQEVHFGGSKLSTQDAKRAPEFKDLPEKTELWVTCG